jgi:hypothetical protein
MELMLWLKRNAEAFSHIAQAFAFLSAAGFFMWKWISGYLVANLTVLPEIYRRRLDVDTDILVTTIHMKKGDRESLLLRKVQVSVTCDGCPLVSTELKSPYVNEKERMIRLSPNEDAQFDHVARVPARAMCDVEILVTGTSGFISRGSFAKGTWKVHKVSLPRESA